MNLTELVGFDYPQAIRKLNQIFTYEEIAKAIGYGSQNSIYKIMNGAVPNHIHGEALWAFYLNTFHVKPPLTTPKRRTPPLSSA